VAEESYDDSAVARSGGRHGWVWRISLVVLSCTLLLRIGELAVGVGSGSRIATVTSFVAIVAILAGAFLIPMFAFRAFSAAQYAAVVRADPGAVVVCAIRAPRTRGALRFVDDRLRLPVFYTWSATSAGMRVWVGGKNARMVADLPWSELERVVVWPGVQLGRTVNTALAVQRRGYAGNILFFVRRPNRPQYPQPTSVVERAETALRALIPQR
jgi:hypothetical protein